ncbi:hypothetical protein EDB19DRAFT_505246 [Suillus lakei]|nr:hypothetical protein EDB19DRAFT_505246 [Suillus lakei]
MSMGVIFFYFSIVISYKQTRPFHIFMWGHLYDRYIRTCNYTTLLACVSLKCSAHTRTRDNSISDAGCRSYSTTTRPLPLQIIPECSEIDSVPFDLSISHEHSRPSPRVTLSAFAFSIDDNLLMLNDAPRSPALSASSSTDDCDSSGEMPPTPGASDDEDICELRLPSPRL